MRYGSPENQLGGFEGLDQREPGAVERDRPGRREVVVFVVAFLRDPDGATQYPQSGAGRVFESEHLAESEDPDCA